MRDPERVLVIGTRGARDAGLDQVSITHGVGRVVRD